MRGVNLGWAAGIFEGEGSLFHRGRALQISVNSTDRDIVDRMQAITGVGSVTFVNFTKKNPEWKDQWRWLVSRRADIRKFLYAIYPLMGERRKARIDEVREWLDSPDQRRKPLRHGTYAGAQRCRPMCDRCRKADNAYQREKWRAKHPRP